MRQFSDDFKLNLLCVAAGDDIAESLIEICLELFGGPDSH